MIGLCSCDCVEAFFSSLQRFVDHLVSQKMLSFDRSLSFSLMAPFAIVYYFGPSMDFCGSGEEYLEMELAG